MRSATTVPSITRCYYVFTFNQFNAYGISEERVEIFWAPDFNSANQEFSKRRGNEETFEVINVNIFDDLSSELKLSAIQI